MTMDRSWKLLPMLLLTLQSIMGDSSTRRRNLPITPFPEIDPVEPISFSTPNPPGGVLGTCQEPGKVVLRLSRIGMRVVGEGVVDSPRVTELHLDDNGITEVSACAFEMVPRLETLNLSSNNISIDRLLHFGEHKGLLRLILDDNKRRDPDNSELKNIYKPLPNLWELSLRRSSVTVFAVSLNKFAPSLGRLSLSGNEIESSKFLKDTPKKLKHLDLSENKISEIGSGWLPNALMELNVAGNRIKELCAESCETSSLSLSQLTMLKTLNASGNAIATVRADAFQNLVSLTVLDLSKNKFHELSETLWDKSWHIHELYLAQNQLTAAPKLCQLGRLHRLDLSGNRINAVTEANFCKSLVHLEFLSLNNNLILEVNSAAFRNFHALRVLDLSDNLLITVPSNLITFTTLNVLFMRSNKVNTLENLAKERGYLQKLHLQKNPLLFINTTWINSNNLPYLQIMLQDQPKSLSAEDKTDKDHCQKENESNSDEDEWS
ncbi:extracellular matrix protein 2 [Halictus rubicundus]|uniref:extracellular matrix protein 2 n=1 Tax=Halictus rubicundus TaxID=77578 RepID=UPI004036285F